MTTDARKTVSQELKALADAILTAPDFQAPADRQQSDDEFTAEARAAAQEIDRAIFAKNTDRSYKSAAKYWQAWHHARYGKPLPFPTPWTVVATFALDHFDRRTRQTASTWLLPPAIDHALVKAGHKKKVGPLALATIEHRIAVLSQAHRRRGMSTSLNPCKHHRVVGFLTGARNIQRQRGRMNPRAKAPLTESPLNKLLDTCDTDIASGSKGTRRRGLRDRAILYFGWASGGRRRSEISNAVYENLHEVDDEYVYELTGGKTVDKNPRKPVTDDAARALRAWLDESKIKSGPLFPRIHAKGELSDRALSGAAIAEMIQQRAARAGLKDPAKYGGHSLRSGFATELGSQRGSVIEGMAMTGHRKVDTFMRYFTAGEMRQMGAARILKRRRL